MARQLAVSFERSVPQRLASHPDAPRHWRRWALERKRPRAIDLFSGCGGLSLGLDQAGYEVILAVDNDRYARETHAHNLPGPCLDFDLSKPDRVSALARLLEGIPIDLVAGGPPCQPFSRAGRAKIRSLVDGGVRDARDERRELWHAFLEIVEAVRPTAVVMENVPDMALEEEARILRAMLTRLEAAGYDAEPRLLDAWRYGVPQHRQRLILQARRDGRPILWPRSRKLVTVRDAISDLPNLRGGTGETEMRAGAPRSAFQRAARKGMNGRSVVWDHVTRPVRPDDREAFALMRPGMRYSDLPEHLRRYRDDIFDDKYNRLGWDALSRSITAHIAKDGYWYIHPSQLRTLTVREAARIQTFPDSFRFSGSRSDAFRQIGNAVPPALGAAVGRSVREAANRPPLGEGERPGSRVRELRALLMSWAKKDARSGAWRYPGDPWQVLVGVILGDRTGGRDEAVERFLHEFPSAGLKASSAIRRASRQQETRTAASWLRLARAAAAWSSSERRGRCERWIERAGLKGADEAFFRVVALGEERILATTPILRVAGRITGTKVAEERRLSDGRLVIARLMGIPKEAPTILAAMTSLGRSICLPTNPHCDRCPLERLCLERRSRLQRRRR